MSGGDGGVVAESVVLHGDEWSHGVGVVVVLLGDEPGFDRCERRGGNEGRERERGSRVRRTRA